MVTAVREPTTLKWVGLKKTVTSLAVDLRKPQEQKPRLGSAKGIRKHLTQSRTPGFSAMSRAGGIILALLGPSLPMPVF